MCEYLVTKKHIGLAEREIHVLVCEHYDFPKPSVHGFPRAADPADRSCRYLGKPPTVPSLARLQGYQRPARGGNFRNFKIFHNKTGKLDRLLFIGPLYLAFQDL
jgi:hypothetical protein